MCSLLLLYPNNLVVSSIYTVSVDTYLISMCSLLLLYPNNPVVSSIYTVLSIPTWSLCAVYSCYIPIILWFPLYILYDTYLLSMCSLLLLYPNNPVVSSIYTVSVDTYLISMCSLLLLYPNNPVVPYIYCICRHLLDLYVQSTPVISQ